MPPNRVARIVAQINGLHPDLVVATGDFVSANFLHIDYSPEQALKPLASLHARLGTYAVLGNNDYDTGGQQVAMALRHAGVRLLVNQVADVGPLALAGIDGRIFHERREWAARRAFVYSRLKNRSGPKIVLFHRPDEFHWAPEWIDLALAGHTHCGQIVLPVLGALETGSDFGNRYLCGIIREDGKLMIVTGGLGTSEVPLRIGAPPDLWVIDLGPARR